MQKVRVGVLRGGPSNEYDISLKTGDSVLAHLSPEKYQPIDVFIDREGVWHVRGIPIAPVRLISQVDVLFNALHGAFGEDGRLQCLLDTYRVPYTGSGALASALGMNKVLTRRPLSSLDIKLPRYKLFSVSSSLEKELLELFRTFPQPVVVKPLSGGSSIGVTVARSFNALKEGVAAAFEHSPQVLVEEYISGREATCGIVENFRDETHYALPPVEIMPPASSTFFDYQAKYGGECREECPGNFTRTEKAELARLSRLVHETLGLRHYSRSDFILSSRGIYFLEVNTLPGLTTQSLLPKALETIGCSYPQFLDHVITQALEQRR